MRLRRSASSAARRAGRTAAPLALTALLLAGCAAAGGDEAVISGKLAPTSADQLESDLKMLTSISSFRDGWKGGTGADANQGGKYSPQLVAYVLQNRYFNALIQAEAKDRKLEPVEVTDAMKTAIAEASPGGQDTIDAYSADYRDSIFLTQRYIEALLTDAGGDPKAYFDAHPEAFTTGCVKHILVGDEATAKAAKDRIAKGEAFEAVAKELSTDPGSKESGGDLGCQSLSTYVPPFAAAAAAVELNTVSDPVKSDFGYHLILVSKRDVAAWDDTTKEKAKQASQQAGVEEIRTALVYRAKAAGTVVNPKYATLNVTQGIPQIDVRQQAGATTTLVDDAATVSEG